MENFRNAFDCVNEIFGELSEEQKVEYNYYNILNDFSIALVEYRMAHSLTQKGLGKILDISTQMVCRYESGDENMTIKRMNEICGMLGIVMEVTFVKPDGEEYRRNQNAE